MYRLATLRLTRRWAPGGRWPADLMDKMAQADA